jgi:hypothetical protein
LTASDWLARWETAAAGQRPLSRRDLQWLTRQHRPALSAHACEVAAPCLGPINAERLSREFNWTIEHVGATTALRAEPCDDATRLFCPALLVELDSTGQLDTLNVQSSTGVWVVVDVPVRVTIELALRVQEETTDLPPSPTAEPSLRLAADQVEFEIDVRR